MGTGKKEAARKVRQGKTGDGMNNVKVKGENFYRYVFESLEYCPAAPSSVLLLFPRSRDS